jgi:CheY-like chemotaxis protein
MNPSIPALIELFRKKINFLVLDDDEIIRESVVRMFSSPLFNTVSAGSLDQALTIIGSTLTGWHCLIVDLDLGDVASGLTLFRKFPGYPFSIVLSGLRSMTLATEAMHLGACAIVDKDPSVLEQLYSQVLKTAALGFLLNGRSSPDLDTFRFLQDPAVDSVEAWADRSGVTTRKLYRICETYPPLTPHYALALYRTIYYMLGLTENITARHHLAIQQFSSEEEQNVYLSWLNYTLLNYKK